MHVVHPIQFYHLACIPTYTLDNVVFVRRVELRAVQSCIDQDGWRTVELRHVLIFARPRPYRLQAHESYPRHCDLSESTKLAALAALNQ